MDKWIAIKDKKPKINKTVLLTDGVDTFAGFKKGRNSYGLLYAHVSEIKIHIEDDELFFDVTHWMELPKAP